MSENKKCHKVVKGNTKPLTKPKRVRSRNWCFTDFELLNLEELYDANKSIIRYIGWGEETCPKTDKVHYQGWIQMNTAKDFSVMKKLMGKKCHLEKCRGTEVMNEQYCRKDDKFKCVGKFVSQGFRTDLEVVMDDIRAGKPMYEIATENPNQFMKYHSGMYKYRQLCEEVNSRKFRKVDVTVISGPTGCGKTSKHYKEDGTVFKICGDDLKWWDGYEGQKTLLIDEYASQIKCTKLLNILDGYQLRLPIKGSFTYARWDKVIITTNLGELHPQANDAHKAALKRRITKWDDMWGSDD